MYFYILTVFFVSVCIYSYWWSVRQFTKRNLPFSWPIPLLGNHGKTVLGLKDLPNHALDIYNKFKGYPYVGAFDFTTRVIMIRDPEVIKLITVKDFDHFTDHRTLLPDDIEPVMSKNLFGLQGEKWRTARNTLSPAFTSSKMKFMFQLVSECGRQLTRHIDNQFQQQECEVLTMDMKDVYTRYTNNVIATAAFGISCNSLEDKDSYFYKMGRMVTNFGGKTFARFLLLIAAPKIFQLLGLTLFPKDAVSFFKNLIFDTVTTREEKNIVRPDMIQLLIEAKKVDKGLTNEIIAAHAFLFFVAGFETSSTLMCFSTLLLAMHPEVQEKLQAEIDEVFNDEEQTISYEALQGMSYLDMVVSETLRLYPPSAFTDRKCVKTYTVPATKNRLELQITEGEIVSLPFIGLHMDPNYFPDPESFKPERFSEENKHNIKPFTYMPFGMGPRSCIGNRFALMETKVALVHLLSKFDFQVVDKTSLPIKLTNSMNNKGGYWLGLTYRNKSKAS